MRHQFYYFLLKIVCFFNLLAAIYDKMFLTRIRIYIRFPMYHIVKDVASLITTSSRNDHLPLGPHSSNERAQYH